MNTQIPPQRYRNDAFIFTLTAHKTTFKCTPVQYYEMYFGFWDRLSSCETLPSMSECLFVALKKILSTVEQINPRKIFMDYWRFLFGLVRMVERRSSEFSLRSSFIPNFSSNSTQIITVIHGNDLLSYPPSSFLSFRSYYEQSRTGHVEDNCADGRFAQSTDEW